MSDSENPVYCGDTTDFVEVSQTEPEVDTVGSVSEEVGADKPSLGEEAQVPATDAPERVEEVSSSSYTISTTDGGDSGGSVRGSSCCSFVAGLPPCVVDLIYWRNVPLSASVLTASLVVLSMVCCCGALNVASLAGLCTITVAFVHRAASAAKSKFTGSPLRNPFQWCLDQPLSMSEEKVEEVARLVARKGTVVLVELRRLFAVQDIPDSLKFGIQLWLAYHLTSLFSFISLLMIAVVIMFSLPKVYELYQVQIDQGIVTLKQQVVGMLEKAKSSPYVGTAINHVMPPKDKQA